MNRDPQHEPGHTTSGALACRGFQVPRAATADANGSSRRKTPDGGPPAPAQPDQRPRTLMDTPDGALLTTEEVAEMLRTPPRTVTDWRYRGVGPPYTKPGKRVLYTCGEVRQWFNSQKR